MSNPTPDLRRDVSPLAPTMVSDVSPNGKPIGHHFSRLYHGSRTEGEPAMSRQSKSKAGASSSLRRASWLSNLGSRFSFSSSSEGNASPPPTSRDNHTGTPPTVVENAPTHASPASSITSQDASTRSPSPPGSPSPRPSAPSFFSSAIKRLSSGGGGGGKVQGHGGVHPRRVMNVDVHRQRCDIHGLQPARLRRVSFFVDVEIAGTSRTVEDLDDAAVVGPADPQMDSATKNETESADRRPKTEDARESNFVPGAPAASDRTNSLEAPNTPDPAPGSVDGLTLAAIDGTKTSRKKEKKKRSEEERKERKVKKHQAAVANGTLPLEIVVNGDNVDTSPPDTPYDVPSTPDPTTDPVRVYRRCCQLREARPNARVLDRLVESKARHGFDGALAQLDLSKITLSYTEVVVLGDYLAVIPVRKLFLHDCGLADEGLRIILASLLAVKTREQARFNRSLSRSQGPAAEPQLERIGVVEKLCIKKNPLIGREGWRHLSVFLFLSQSLKAIDISSNPMPRASNNIDANARKDTTPNAPNLLTQRMDTIPLMAECIRERRSSVPLEEVVVDGCELTDIQAQELLSALRASGVHRLGLANNSLGPEAFAVLAEYVKSGVCDVLDIGGSDLVAHLDKVLEALASPSKDFHLFALGLSSCDLTVSLLERLLPTLAGLPDLRFLDLSHNPTLFAMNSDAVTLLRLWLPRISGLKRLHLNDVGMTPEQCIALAQVFPNIELLGHVSLTGNPAISRLASTTTESAQAETFALYTSLMTAVRVSGTIVSLDIDVPSAESSELIKAMAKQIVARCLHNMESGPVAKDLAPSEAVQRPTEKGALVPDVLLHLVGHIEGYPDNHDDDDPAPNDDYLVSGSAIVKALSICLGDKTADGISRSSDVTPGPSETNEAKRSHDPCGRGQAMSMDLLSSARKIKMRLQPALTREGKNGDYVSLKRLQFLDSTLAGIIERFEAEFPESRPPKPPAVTLSHSGSDDVGDGPASAEMGPGSAATKSATEADETIDDDHLNGRPTASRKGSDVSLASRYLTQEEGLAHRVGQRVRRDLLGPAVAIGDDFEQSPHTEERIQAVKARLEAMSAEEIRERFSDLDGSDIWAKLGMSQDDVQPEDRLGFAKFVEAHLHAINNRQVETLTDS